MLLARIHTTSPLLTNPDSMVTLLVTWKLRQLIVEPCGDLGATEGTAESRERFYIRNLTAR